MEKNKLSLKRKKWIRLRIFGDRLKEFSFPFFTSNVVLLILVFIPFFIILFIYSLNHSLVHRLNIKINVRIYA